MARMLIATVWWMASSMACGSKSPPPASPAPVPAEPAGSAGAEHQAPLETAPPAAPAPAKTAPEAPAMADALAAENAAYVTARPVFEKYCAACHTKAGKKAGKKKLDHFDMSAYPFGGEHAPFIGMHVREVLGLTGKKPTMPKDKPGIVKGDELAAIQAWADAWQAAESAGAHPPHGEDADKD